MTTDDEQRPAGAMRRRSSSSGNSSPPGKPEGSRIGRWAGRLLGDARTRVVGWFVAVVALAVVGSVLAGRQVLLTRMEARIDRELRQEAEELRRLAGGVNPATGAPFGTDVAAIFDLYVERNVTHRYERVFFFVNGEQYRPQELPPDFQPPLDVERAWATTTRPVRSSFTGDAGIVDYLALPLQQAERTLGVFVVAMYADVEREEVARLVSTMTISGIVAILVAAALSWFGAGRILAPIRRLTATAESISEHDLSRRIAVEGEDDVARLARTFNAMLDRLQRAFASQRQFLNDVGHELRTPITIVRGHLEVLGDDPQERRETVALVVDELERMRRLVDDLVVLAKAEQPDFLDRQTVDVDDLAHEIVRKASGLADRDWLLEASEPGTIEADRQRLTQAVVQLAQNAVQHTAAGDTIALGVSMVDDEAHFWVRDTGPGFDGQDPARLFDRFVSGRREGTGLGLAIVKAIAVAHGGDVAAREAPGGGALFTIMVPRQPRGADRMVG